MTPETSKCLDTWYAAMQPDITIGAGAGGAGTSEEEAKIELSNKLKLALQALQGAAPQSIDAAILLTRPLAADPLAAVVRSLVDALRGELTIDIDVVVVKHTRPALVVCSRVVEAPVAGVLVAALDDLPNPAYGFVVSERNGVLRIASKPPRDS